MEQALAQVEFLVSLTASFPWLKWWYKNCFVERTCQRDKVKVGTLSMSTCGNLKNGQGGEVNGSIRGWQEINRWNFWCCSKAKACAKCLATHRNERPTPHLTKIWGAVGTTMVLHHQNHLQMDKQRWIFPCQLWCMENGSENGMFLDDLPIKWWFTQLSMVIYPWKMLIYLLNGDLPSYKWWFTHEKCWFTY